VVAFSDHCVSTSKFSNWFHGGPKNTKQLGLDANSICLPTKIYRKLFQWVYIPQNLNQLLNGCFKSSNYRFLEVSFMCINCISMLLYFWNSLRIILENHSLCTFLYDRCCRLWELWAMWLVTLLSAGTSSWATVLWCLCLLSSLRIQSCQWGCQCYEMPHV